MSQDADTQTAASVNERHVDFGPKSFSFRWTALQMFCRGIPTNKIAEKLNAKARKRVGAFRPITEARVYNEISKAKNEIYERGLTMPVVNGGEFNTVKQETSNETI